MAPSPPENKGDAAKRRRDAASIAFCCLAVLAAVLVAHATGRVLCPLKRLTGIPCPSCGATRACISVLRGDIREAFRLQPFAVALAFGAVPALLAACALAGRERVRSAVAAAFARRSVRLVCLALLVADWIYVVLNGN